MATWFERVIFPFFSRKRELFIYTHRRPASGPNELSFCTAHAIQPLQSINGLPKGPCEVSYYLHALPPFLRTLYLDWDGRGSHDTIPSLIATRDPIEHAKRRQPWNQGFSTAALKDYEDVIGESCRTLTEALENRLGEVLDMTAWMSCFSCVCGRLGSTRPFALTPNMDRFDTMGALV